MARILIATILVMLLCTAVWAHNGMLALFTDGTVSDCDAEIGQFETVDIMLVYLRGDGPEMGNAWEFRLLSSYDGVVYGTSVWHPAVEMPSIGSLETGMSIAAGVPCLGKDLDVVYLGTIPVICVGEPGTFTISVVEDPIANPPGIYITLCEKGMPMHEVGGGVFVFNGECEPPGATGRTAVEESSWGAIKDIYRK